MAVWLDTTVKREKNTRRMITTSVGFFFLHKSIPCPHVSCTKKRRRSVLAGRCSMTCNTKRLVLHLHWKIILSSNEKDYFFLNQTSLVRDWLTRLLKAAVFSLVIVSSWVNMEDNSHFMYCSSYQLKNVTLPTTSLFLRLDNYLMFGSTSGPVM